MDPPSIGLQGPHPASARGHLASLTLPYGRERYEASWPLVMCLEEVGAVLRARPCKMAVAAGCILIGQPGGRAGRVLGGSFAAGSLVLRPRAFFVALGAVLRARPCKMVPPLAGSDTWPTSGRASRAGRCTRRGRLARTAPHGSPGAPRGALCGPGSTAPRATAAPGSGGAFFEGGRSDYLLSCT